MLRIRKRHNIKDQSHYSFNDTVVYYMKIDVCHIRLRKFYLPQKRLQLFISKSDNFMLNLSNSQ